MKQGQVLLHSKQVSMVSLVKENLQRANGEPYSEDLHSKMLRLLLQITFMIKDSFRMFLRSSSPYQEGGCM